MILVDTSAWVEFFRGPGVYADAVEDLLEANEVALCGPVVAELRRGLGRGRTRTRVLDLLGGCQLLAQPASLWQEAGDLGAALRRRGATVKTLDILIATYALTHSLEVLSSDSDFELMARGNIGLRLASP